MITQAALKSFEELGVVHTIEYSENLYQNVRESVSGSFYSISQLETQLTVELAVSDDWESEKLGTSYVIDKEVWQVVKPDVTLLDPKKIPKSSKPTLVTLVLKR